MSDRSPYTGASSYPGAIYPTTGGAPSPAPEEASRPPWGLWEALLVVMVFALSQPLFSLAGSLALSLLLPAVFHSSGAADEIFKFLLPGVIFSSHVVGWGGMYWLIALRHRQPFFSGLRFGLFSRFRVLRIFGAGMLLQVLGVFMAVWFPPPEDLDNPMLRYISLGGWAVVILFLMAVLLAPFLEEALFRGVLYPALRRRWRFFPAALMVSALFTALHAVQTSGYWPALVLIFICGWVLAYLREASGHLWPPVLFHMGFNFTALLPIILLGGEIPESLPALLAL